MLTFELQQKQGSCTSKKNDEHQENELKRWKKEKDTKNRGS